MYEDWVNKQFSGNGVDSDEERHDDDIFGPETTTIGDFSESVSGNQ